MDADEDVTRLSVQIFLSAFIGVHLRFNILRIFAVHSDGTSAIRPR